MWAFWAFLIPKMHWGLKTMWKKFREFAKKIGHLRRNFVQPTLSDLLSVTQPFSNPATRWQCSTPDSCNSLLFSSLTTFVFSLYEQKKTGKSILICTRFNEYLRIDLSKNEFTSEGVYSCFAIESSEKSQF